MRLSGGHVNRRPHLAPAEEGCAMPWDEEMLRGIEQWKREQRAAVIAKAGLVLNDRSVEFLDPAREASRQRMIAMNQARAKKKPGLKFPPQSVRPLFQGNSVPHSLFRQALGVVAAEFNFAVPDLLLKTWDKRLVHARHVLMFLFTRRGYSTPTIGRSLEMHHATVLYGSCVAKELFEADPKFQELIARLEAQIAVESPPGRRAVA